MSNYVSSPKLQFFYPLTQTPLASGKLYTYITGTTTDITTYPTPADYQALTNAHTNPIILDSSGCTTVVLTGATRFTVKDSSGNLIYTLDEIQPNSAASAGASILDSNSNELIKFTTTAAAVNEITIANAATGNSPSVSATGGDTNINLTVQGKGTGVVTIPSLTVTSSALIIGDTSAASVAAGYVGEQLTSTVSGTSLSSAALTNLTTLSLTPGTWDVFGSITATPAGSTTTTSLKCGFNTVSATLPSAYSATAGSGANAGVVTGFNAPIARFAVSVNTTVYFVVQVTFAVSTLTAAATVFAQRIL